MTKVQQEIYDAIKAGATLSRHVHDSGFRLIESGGFARKVPYKTGSIVREMPGIYSEQHTGGMYWKWMEPAKLMKIQQVEKLRREKEEYRRKREQQEREQTINAKIANELAVVLEGRSSPLGPGTIDAVMTIVRRYATTGE